MRPGAHKRGGFINRTPPVPLMEYWAFSIGLRHPEDWRLRQKEADGPRGKIVLPEKTDE